MRFSAAGRLTLLALNPAAMRAQGPKHITGFGQLASVATLWSHDGWCLFFLLAGWLMSDVRWMSRGLIRPVLGWCWEASPLMSSVESWRVVVNC